MKNVAVGCLLYLFASAFLVATSFDASKLEALPLFGNARVLMVYCLATLPLAFVTISHSARLQSLRAWCGLASLGLIAVAIIPQLAHLFTQADASAGPRVVVRSVLAWVWCAPLAIAIAEFIEQRQLTGTSSQLGQRWLWAGAVAFILPAVYTHVQVSKLQQSLETLAGSSRVASELTHWNQVLELSGEELNRGGNFRAHVRQLRRHFDELSIAVAQPLPVSATINEVQLRAIQLLSLDRAIEAEQITTAVFNDSSHQLTPNAYVSLRTLQAVAARESKHWNDVLTIAQSILVQTPDDQLARELQAQAYVGLHQPTKAIDIYEQLLDGFTSEEPTAGSTSAKNPAALHFQLAKLWMDCGNGRRAIHHCAEARRFDPTLATQTASLERTVLQHSCTLQR